MAWRARRCGTRTNRWSGVCSTTTPVAEQQSQSLERGLHNQASGEGKEDEEMRKIHRLGLALFAMFAFGAMAAASAFAADEWLFNGSPITVELPTNTEGTLTLDVLNLEGVLVNAINCSGLFEGTVGPGAIDLVLDLFSLTGALIGELGGTSLDCETVSNPTGMACPVGGETLLWVDELSLTLGLTWETLVELMATAPEFLLRFHHVAFELLCFLGGVTNLEALCEGVTSGKLENVAAGVLLEFNPAAPIASEELACTNNLEPSVSITAGLEGDVVIKHTGPGTLAVS